MSAAQLLSGSVFSPWMVIAAMAIVTALTRFTGYWLLGTRSLGPRLQMALEAVPASVLVSIIAPTVLATGVAETIAGLATILLAWRFPTIVAIIGGVFLVVVLRMFL